LLVHLKDSEKGGPISYANVVVLGTKIGTQTDSEGLAMVCGLKPGTWRLRANAIGFETKVD